MRRRSTIRSVKVIAKQFTELNQRADFSHKDTERSWHRKRRRLYANGRDSKPKMLGVKAFGGETVSAGSIIVRQRGTSSTRRQRRCGQGPHLFALVDGQGVVWHQGALNKYNGECHRSLMVVDWLPTRNPTPQAWVFSVRAFDGAHPFATGSVRLHSGTYGT